MTVYALAEHRPTIHPSAWIAPNAVVIGDATLAENVSVWWNAVIRADSATIEIGANSNIQDGSVLHVDKDIPLRIGANVTVGHLAMVHGCTIHDNSLIAIGAIVLNHAVIGKNSIVGAGALVPEGKVYPDGVLIMGRPGKVVRELSAKEIEYLSYASSHYVENSARYRAELQAL
ncbi:MAG: gamma carbonic anhydrase family protein [Sphingomonadales bacterium]|nr:gamma carbonic anhydrase family protein [Sphingomonadales bacterium]